MRVPEVGDAVRYAQDGEWIGRGSVRTGDGKTPAEITERVPVPPPSVPRGRQVRWHEGRWEKLMVKGWVPAGEGRPVDASRPARGTKTKAQIASEIDDYLKR